MKGSAPGSSISPTSTAVAWAAAAAPGGRGVAPSAAGEGAEADGAGCARISKNSTRRRTTAAKRGRAGGQESWPKRTRRGMHGTVGALGRELNSRTRRSAWGKSCLHDQRRVPGSGDGAPHGAERIHVADDRHPTSRTWNDVFDMVNEKVYRKRSFISTVLAMVISRKFHTHRTTQPKTCRLRAESHPACNRARHATEFSSGFVDKPNRRNMFVLCIAKQCSEGCFNAMAQSNKMFLLT